MEKLNKQAETRICKAIFPNTLNANDSLFGGLAMQWMDEAAFIAATRFTKQRMFTLKVSDINFLRTVHTNSFVEIIARVKSAGPVKLQVQVDMMAENMFGKELYKAAEACFTMVSLNDNHKPQRLLNYSIPCELIV